MCKKRDFEVDQLMAPIQHASIRLKNSLYKKDKEEMVVPTLDPSTPTPICPEYRQLYNTQ